MARIPIDRRLCEKRPSIIDDCVSLPGYGGLVSIALMHAYTARPRQFALWGLIGWLSLAFVAAGIGALASVDAASFYAQLDRPAWAPPSWLFGPVWTALYAMMGVAAWLVWRERESTAQLALALFVVQLAFNALWSWLFFRWHEGALAFIDVVLLWCLIVAMVLAFRQTGLLAAALLVPYLFWVTFASALTLAVWQANPEALG